MRLKLAYPFTFSMSLALAPLALAQSQQQGDYAGVELGIALGATTVYTPAEQSSSSNPFQVSEFRIKIDGHVGGWVHPVVSLEVLDGPAVASWPFLFHGEGGVLSDVNWQGAQPGYGVFDHAVDKLHFADRMVDLMMTGGYGNLSNTEVQTWAQPILSPESTAGFVVNGRVWRADSPLWNGPIGDFHRSTWVSLLAERGDAVEDYLTFDTIAAIRHMIVEQSIYKTGSTTAAAQFLASGDWTDAVEDQTTFALGVQAIALRAAVLPAGIEVEDDDDAPDLAQVAGPVPFYGGSATAKIIILYQELTRGFVELGLEALIPNTRVYFDAPHMTANGRLRFSREGGGYVEFPVYPAPLKNQAGRCCSFIGPNAGSGPVYAKDDLTTTWVQVADVVVDHGGQQGTGQ